MKIGVIGCGMISDVYLKNFTTIFSDKINVIGVADINLLASDEKAKKYNLKSMSVDELINNQEIELIVDLTNPASHYEIGMKCLNANKSHYSEKPLALTIKEGEELLNLANKKGLYCACAPDTFLGDGYHFVKKVLLEGVIGKLIGFSANLLSRGPESFHLNPRFLYSNGAGPLMDMGPYYLTSLVKLFGNVDKVISLNKKTYNERTVMNEKSKLYSTKFSVYVDTYYSSLLEFKNGIIGNITITWDMGNAYWKSEVPNLVIYGTDGMLICPDPNTFSGISDNPFGEPTNYIVIRHNDGNEEKIEYETKYNFNARGLGVYQYVISKELKKEPEITPKLCMHVLEVMLSIVNSKNEFIKIKNQL